MQKRTAMDKKTTEKRYGKMGVKILAGLTTKQVGSIYRYAQWWDRKQEFDFCGEPKKGRMCKIKNSFNTIIGRLPSPFTESDCELPEKPSYLEIDCLDHLYHAYACEGYSSGHGLITHIRKGLAYSQGVRAHILSQDGHCIGFYITHKDNGYFCLCFFYLIPSFRCQGIFTEIFNNIIAINKNVIVEYPSSNMVKALAAIGHGDASNSNMYLIESTKTQ